MAAPLACANILPESSKTESFTEKDPFPVSNVLMGGIRTSSVRNSNKENDVHQSNCSSSQHPTTDIKRKTRDPILYLLFVLRLIVVMTIQMTFLWMR